MVTNTAVDVGKYRRNQLHRAEQTDRDKGGERLQERNRQQSGRGNEKKGKRIKKEAALKEGQS